jgi:prevent-host-death family protein
MPVTTVNSREARKKWRSLLDTAYAGDGDIVIERYGEPIAAIIPFDDFLALQKELDELRVARRARQVYEQWQRNSTGARPYAKVRRELVAEGLLNG